MSRRPGRLRADWPKGLLSSLLSRPHCADVRAPRFHHYLIPSARAHARPHRAPLDAIVTEHCRRRTVGLCCARCAVLCAVPCRCAGLVDQSARCSSPAPGLLRHAYHAGVRHDRHTLPSQSPAAIDALAKDTEPAEHYVGLNAGRRNAPGPEIQTHRLQGAWRWKLRVESTDAAHAAAQRRGQRNG